MVVCVCVGARETDYPAGEEVVHMSEAGPGPEDTSPTAGSDSGCSVGGDGVLGGITVVGCSAEGVSAVPQTAEFMAESETGENGTQLSGSNPDNKQYYVTGERLPLNWCVSVCV